MTYRLTFTNDRAKTTREVFDTEAEMRTFFERMLTRYTGWKLEVAKTSEGDTKYRRTRLPRP